MTAQVIPFPKRQWEPYVGKRQVAEYCGRSTRWVELKIVNDGLPWHPPAPGSNRRRFLLSEIDEWLERRRSA